MKKRGISLIVLVITIIVIIILAVAVILSIANNNPIENAKKAAFQNDIATLKEELDLYIQKQYVDSQGTYKASDLNKSGEDIKEILPDIKDKYIGKIAINGGSLEYTDESNMQEYNWASETLTGEKSNYDKAVSSDSKNMQINNAIAGKLGNLKIYGNSIQNGTPTPDNPVEIQSVGELVTDANDSNYGKYKIPVTVTGKNIGTAKQVYSGLKKSAGTANDSRYTEKIRDGRECVYFVDNFEMKYSDIYFRENTQYTFSFDYKQTLNSSSASKETSDLLCIWYTDSSRDDIVVSNPNHETEWKHISYTSKANKTIKAIGTISHNYRFGNYIDINTFQIEEGNKETDYEPYKGQTTNIYLNEPLRKVGDAVDYIDFKNKKVVRNVKERVFDGTERWELGASGINTVNQRFYLADSDLLSNGRLLSNILVEKYPGRASIFTQDVEGCNISNGIFYQLKINKTYLTNLNYDVSVSGFKKYLSDLKNENKPVKVCTTLESKTEEKILNLPEISTINGTNNISIGTSVNPSKMEVIYGK